ncbi:MAG: helix-turn-helix domain-containing protein [Vicinamibacterales bacterium]
MNRSYGQYCPLALAVEMLGERWTLLIVSRLFDGCSQFNEIHRSVPKISPSLLSKRLDELVAAGILERVPATPQAPAHYALTDAGRELEPIIVQLAVWGHQWARDMVDADLDPEFLLWSMSTRLDTAAMPPGRTVIEFEFTGTTTDFRGYWLVHDRGNVDMCLKDPGFEVTLHVKAELRRFIETWRGFRDFRTEIRAGHIEVVGPSRLARQLPTWLMLSGFAGLPRKRPGTEQRMAARRMPPDARPRRGRGRAEARATTG